MSLPYKIYTDSVGTGPFSYSTILFMSGVPVTNQINVYKNTVKLVKGTGPGDGAYYIQETSQSVTLETALISTDTLEIRRETEDLQRISSFSDGARLSASSLNKSLDQLFFLIQEKSFYSTTVEEFPATLFNIIGTIQNRDVVTWESAQQRFVPGNLNVGINELNDVLYDQGTVAVDQLLGWSGTQWVPTTNISFNSAANITFTGDCTFSNPVTIANGSGSSHAVSRGQIDTIVQSHMTTVTAGLQDRITALESSKMEILGKGRYWNTAGNYYPKLVHDTGTTFPVFDTSAAQVDYENLYNVVCRSAGWVPVIGNNHAESSDINSGKSTLVGTWVYWDTFTWDFNFSDALLPDEKSRSNLESNQYHVIIDVDGKSDTWEGIQRGNTFEYNVFLTEDLTFTAAADTNANGLYPEMVDNWPFYMNLHNYAGGKPLNGANIAGEGKWGAGHYFQNHNDSYQYQNISSTVSAHLEDWKDGMGSVTEPMTLGPTAFNKTSTGFSIMYAIKRPIWWKANTLGAKWIPQMFLYNHGTAQVSNDPSNGIYSAHPLLKDFNFRFTVIQ